MDVHTPEQRSRNMAAIRSKNTKPELYLRKLLFANGFRYRLYSKRIPGKPDLWLAKYRTAIFVHGCFWHRHQGCRYASTPKNNSDFWQAKFNRNIERDQLAQKQILKNGQRVLVVWECTIKKMMKDKEYEQEMLNRVSAFLTGPDRSLEL